MTTFHVTATRDGKWWALQCAEVPNAISQSRDLAGAQVIREAIALMAEVPEYTVAVELDVVLPEDIRSDLEHYRQLVAQEAAIQTERVQAQQTLVKELTKKAKLSYRDAAELLGISHQRVGQLVSRQRGTRKVRSVG